MTIELHATTPSGLPIVAALTREFPAIDYGVVGDGARDDWGALNEAMNAAKGQGGGRVVLPPACTVMVSRRVNIPAWVELVVPWSTTLRLMAGSNVDLIGMDGINASVRGGGTLDGNRANQTTAGLYVLNVHAYNCMVEDVRVVGARGSGVILNTTTSCELRGLTVEDVGMHAVEVWKSDRNVIQGLIARDVGRLAAPGQADAVRLILSSSYNAITGVTLTDSAGGAGTAGYGVREEMPGFTGDWNVIAAVAAGPGTVWSHQITAPHSGFQPPSGVGSQLGPLNLLTNGGLEIWQRGAGPFTGAGTFCADRWFISQFGAATLSVSRVAADAGQGSQYAAGFTYTHAAGQSAYLAQRVENWQQFPGRYVAVQAFVKASVPGSVRLVVGDGLTSYYSGYNVGTTGESLNLAVPLVAGALALEVRVLFDVASVTGYVDSVTLVAGPTPAYYTPMNPADELHRCQRYYQEIGGLQIQELIMEMQAISATVAVGTYTFPVEMAGPPAVTASAIGDWSVLNAAGARQTCTALTFTATRKNLRIDATVAAGLAAGNGVGLMANNTLSARLRIESNP